MVNHNRQKDDNTGYNLTVYTFRHYALGTFHLEHTRQVKSRNKTTAGRSVILCYTLTGSGYAGRARGSPNLCSLKIYPATGMLLYAEPPLNVAEAEGPP